MEEAAKQISESCYYAHSSAGGDGNYGQNIGAGATAQNVNALITNLMYNNETELYPGPYGSEPDMTNFEPWGHYSQIVWASTTEVGCYTNDCSAQGLRNIGPHVGPQFTVCNYYPPGNMGGEYGKNVPAPGHKLPMITIKESS
jgi:Cysteine-rich secretory protein family